MPLRPEHDRDPRLQSRPRELPLTLRLALLAIGVATPTFAEPGLEWAVRGGGSGKDSAQTITADAAGNVFIAGHFNAVTSLGSTSLTNSGTTDAFVAKLDPVTLAPAWAVRMGGPAADEGHGIAADSTGDIVAVGLFNQTTTGVAALVANGKAASDAFVLKLGADGTNQFAHAYGDGSTQTADRVVINRIGAGPVKDLVEFAGFDTGTIDFGMAAGAVTWVGGNSYLVLAALQ